MKRFVSLGTAMMVGVVIGREKDSYDFTHDITEYQSVAAPHPFLEAAKRRDSVREDSVVSSHENSSEHLDVMQTNGQCRTKKIANATQTECYNAATRRWTVTKTEGDCRDKRVANATVRECYNVATRRWAVTQTIPDCRERRQGRSTIKECYNTATRRWDIT